MTVDVIIPTYKPDNVLNKAIEMLENQTKNINKIWIVNTEEELFGKNDYSRYENIHIQHIKRNEFDHGGTRNLAAKNSNADILVFMTQDAIPRNRQFIEQIIKPFENERVAATYGRQVAREKATPIEKFTREFNYPKEDKIKSIEDIKVMGIKTFFCTNVCSAFRTTDFWNHNGFPEKTILNEDMIMSSKLIFDNKKIVYASNAEVVHSHSYTYWQQFTRNFDIAVSLRENGEILKYAKSETEGIKFVKEAIKYLISIKKIYLIPDLILESGFKFLGYRFGMKYDKLPKELVKKFSMTKSYWKW